MSNKQPIVIAAGGTGGHFFPAEALASALIARGERVVLMTDARSGGLASPVFSGGEQHVIAGGGLAGKGIKKAARGGAALLQGIAQAHGVLRKIRPGAVVAFGGYPAVPPVLAARFLRPRPAVILHEQNAVLGRANRLLARLADRLVLSFEGTQKIPRGVLTIVLGNPVRPAITALWNQGFKAPDGRIEILVLGGSLGAKIFGTLVPAALSLLPERLRRQLAVTQQCRNEELAEARRIYHDCGIAAELSPFFTDVALRLQRAHLVIARAGASTVAETAVAARPAIFIPLPSAIDDHQRANADAQVAAGAAWRMDQAQLTPRALADMVESLITTPDRLIKAAAAAATHARAEAASRLADMVQAMMAGAQP